MKLSIETFNQIYQVSQKCFVPTCSHGLAQLCRALKVPLARDCKVGSFSPSNFGGLSDILSYSLLVVAWRRTVLCEIVKASLDTKQLEH